MTDKRPAWLKRMDPNNLLAPPKHARCSCKVCAPDHDYFTMCPDCGNKRCPRATFHGHDCGKSNSTGQIGSTYGTVLCGQSKCKCIKLNAQMEQSRAEWQELFPNITKEQR